jgi:hypothetical protein
MKYLKVIVGLGLIPLGVFAGSFIRLGGGNGAILGGILGVILCCILFWSSAPHWPGSASLDELYIDNKQRQEETGDRYYGQEYAGSPNRRRLTLSRDRPPFLALRAMVLHLFETPSHSSLLDPIVSKGPRE